MTNFPPPGGYPGQPPQPGPYGPPPGQQYVPYGPPQGQYAGPPPQQGGFGWGPQFGPPGYGPPGPPPRKKSNTGLIVGLAIIATAVLGVGLIALALRSGDEPQAEPRWTPSATKPTYSPTYEPTNEPTADPTSPPPPPPPTQPQPRPTKTTPPPPPKPSDLQVVRRDKFYFTGLHTGVGCREPSVRPTSARNAATYHGLVIRGCLDKAFVRQLRAAGDPTSPPAIIYWSGSVSTPCSGGIPNVSFFCSVNDTIYVLLDEPLELWQKWGATGGSRGRIAARMRMTHLAAHEYGHHLQHASGILEAVHDLRYQANSRDAALEWSRRLELQASCFAAVFASANRQSYGITGAVKSGWDWVTNTGDRPAGPRDHGSRRNHVYWTERGWNSRNLALCNTFVASPALVR